MRHYRCPNRQIESGIERPGHPGRSTAVFPAIALPCFVALLAFAWYREKAPGQATRLGIERCQVSANRAVAARHANNHFVFHK